MSAPIEARTETVKAGGAGALHLSVLATITLALLHGLGAINITLLAALAPVLAWAGLWGVIILAALTVSILAAIVGALAKGN